MPIECYATGPIDMIVIGAHQDHLRTKKGSPQKRGKPLATCGVCLMANTVMMRKAA